MQAPKFICVGKYIKLFSSITFFKATLVKVTFNIHMYESIDGYRGTHWYIKNAFVGIYVNQTGCSKSYFYGSLYYGLLEILKLLSLTPKWLR